MPRNGAPPAFDPPSDYDKIGTAPRQARASAAGVHAPSPKQSPIAAQTGFASSNRFTTTAMSFSNQASGRASGPFSVPHEVKSSRCRANESSLTQRSAGHARRLQQSNALQERSELAAAVRNHQHGAGKILWLAQRALGSESGHI